MIEVASPTIRLVISVKLKSEMAHAKSGQSLADSIK
jgi:hypothetical protein